jgi:4-hydroxybenzoate polyprenyltransferase
VAEMPYWMGIPALGFLAVGTRPALATSFAFALAVTALVAHLLMFNDWGGLVLNPAEGARIGLSAPLAAAQTRALRNASIALLLVGIAAAAAISPLAALATGLGGVLSVLYSHPRIHLKASLPGALALHFAFGLLTFELGFSAAGGELLRALPLGVFFALLLVAGQLVHQCIDRDEDHAGGVTTAAVRLGTGPLLRAGVGVFSASHALIIALGLAGQVQPIVAFAFALPLVTHLRMALALRGAAPLPQTELLAYRQRYRRLFVLASAVFAAVAQRA